LVSLPLCLIVAVLLTDLKFTQKASIIASSLVLATLLVDTALQVPRFSDDTTIYASALKVAPHSFLAHGYYAEALWNYGRHEEGLREFKTVTELSPRSGAAHERYGAALAEIGRDDEALAEYKKALELSVRPNPFRAFLLSETAQIELKRSEFSEAAAHLREAVQIAPHTLNYHSLLAQALTRQGQTQEADEEMRDQRASRE